MNTFREGIQLIELAVRFRIPALLEQLKRVFKQRQQPQDGMTRKDRGLFPIFISPFFFSYNSFFFSLVVGEAPLQSDGREYLISVKTVTDLLKVCDDLKPDMEDVRDTAIHFLTRNYPEVSVTSHFKQLSPELREEVFCGVCVLA